MSVQPLAFGDLVATQFGFRWGCLEVIRLADDPKFGYVLEVKTDLGRKVEIRITTKGNFIYVSGDYHE